MTANGRGRKLKPRTDTERLDLLVKLIGYGQGRGELMITWDENDGDLNLHSGRYFQEFVASDANGDLRALLDRAISLKAGATKRSPRRKRSVGPRSGRDDGAI